MSNLEHEREKYKGIYSAKEGYVGYGHSNHGNRAIRHVAVAMKPESVLDVGCGYNEFKKQVLELKKDLKITGVDFACPGADIISDAHNLPFKDKEWDVLTSFDMLEHILPDQVDLVLKEFARVSKRFVFSIAHQPSVIKWKGENLHPTVHSENWWILRIMHHGGFNIKKVDRYITGEWKDTLHMPEDANIILVGNGPSLNKQNGKLIDSFETVIRFNQYNTGPEFAKHTGTKTSIWSTFGKGVFPGVEERPDRIIYIHGEVGDPTYQAKEVYRIPRWYFAHVTRSVGARNEQNMGLFGDPWHPYTERELIPTSGLLVSSWLLQVVGVKKLHLVGFDHFSKKESKQHHHYNPKAFGRPKEHNGDIEELIFKDLERNGRIVYLRA